MKCMTIAGVAGLMLMVASQTVAKPLKVYILIGQSNMEGPANIKTIDYIGDDPRTAPMLCEMVNPDGTHVVCDHAWISYLTGAQEKNFELNGKLTAGYGTMWGQDPTKPGKCIGPEFTFGIYMSKALKEPFLIIKAAWGGKSLNTDFRSPSAGPYKLDEGKEKFFIEHPGAHGVPKDLAQWKTEKAEATGVYYRLMIEHVKKVLADPKRVCPAYDPKAGYELAGFVWFQGWNDMCDSTTYPESHKPGGYAEYTRLMTHFIRDVRKDLSAPKMPFVIGVMGVNGEKATGGLANIRPAMAAPAEMPEFKGNVIAVPTAPYWDEKLGDIDEKNAKVRQMRWFLDSKHKDHPNADGQMTEAQKKDCVKAFEGKLITPEDKAIWTRGASNAGYHYLGCAKTFALMGKAFAEALNGMEKK